LRYGLGDGDPWVKKDFDYCNTVIGSRFEVLDVIYSSSKYSFRRIDHSLLDIRTGQTGVAPDDTDDRNIDVRQNVSRRSQQDERSHQQ
jgi:hypothetical protein